MRHSPVALLGTLIPDAGFHVESEGDLPSLLYHVRAVRPAAGASMPEAGWGAPYCWLGCWRDRGRRAVVLRLGS
ncbi:hypothetical protein [Microbispora sp. NPDC049125]|uniref:hypothetical protein n=1 Tax=Microbispora sp. NPDC049125 TaxID=3154929 RepID=UPI0034671AAB